MPGCFCLGAADPFGPGALWPRVASLWSSLLLGRDCLSCLRPLQWFPNSTVTENISHGVSALPHFHQPPKDLLISTSINCFPMGLFWCFLISLELSQILIFRVLTSGVSSVLPFGPQGFSGVALFCSESHATVSRVIQMLSLLVPVALQWCLGVAGWSVCKYLFTDENTRPSIGIPTPNCLLVLLLHCTPYSTAQRSTPSARLKSHWKQHPASKPLFLWASPLD